MIMTPLADAALAAEQARHAEVEALQAQITVDTLNEAAMIQTLDAANLQIADLQAQADSANAADQAQIAALNDQLSALQTQAIADAQAIAQLQLAKAPGIDFFGMNLVFAASFPGSASLAAFDTYWKDWNVRTLSSNHEAQQYVDPGQPGDPFSFANNALIITAQPFAGLPNGLTYSSGALQAKTTYGPGHYFEARLKMPPASVGPGFWPAWWGTTPGVWPPEVDPLEFFSAPNGNGEGGSTKLHVGAIGRTTGNGSSGLAGTAWKTVADLSAGYHDYGWLIMPDWTTLYLDRVSTYAIRTPPQFLVPFYFRLNLAVGGPGSWPGVPNAGAVAQLGVAHVRIYNVGAVSTLALGSMLATLPLTPTPDGVDTLPYGAQTVAGPIKAPGATVTVRCSRDCTGQVSTTSPHYNLVIDGVVTGASTAVPGTGPQSASFSAAVYGGRTIGVKFTDQYSFTNGHRLLNVFDVTVDDPARGYHAVLTPAQVISNTGGTVVPQADGSIKMLTNGIVTFTLPHP